jgi:butyrate kinase
VTAAAARGEGAAARALAAMAYQVSKEIAMHGATLEGRVDRIVLTGGLAHDRDFVELIAARVRFLAPVEVLPGEREMLSLVRGYRAVRRGLQTAKEYIP